MTLRCSAMLQFFYASFKWNIIIIMVLFYLFIQYYAVLKKISFKWNIFNNIEVISTLSRINMYDSLTNLPSLLNQLFRKISGAIW